jgi:hypothetical protein
MGAEETEADTDTDAYPDADSHRDAHAHRDAHPDTIRLRLDGGPG